MYPFDHRPISPPQDVPVPESALVFHRHGAGYDITHHRINQSNNRYEMGAGSPITVDALDALLLAVRDSEARALEILPDTVLAHSPVHSVWYTRPQTRKMFIQAGRRSLVLTVPWPALIFSVRNGQLSIAAFKGRKRPQAKTALYHAPLMNIYDNGRLCTGSINLPARCTPSDHPAWESTIFDTKFTHINHPKTLRLPRDERRDDQGVTTAEHVRFWKHLDKTNAQRFPSDALVPMNTTLSNFVDPRACAF